MLARTQRHFICLLIILVRTHCSTYIALSKPLGKKMNQKPDLDLKKRCSISLQFLTFTHSFYYPIQGLRGRGLSLSQLP